RAQRLVQALEAYGEALRFRTPDTAPLDYAQTQNNRANLLGELASLPGENRLERLAEALRAAWTAFTLFNGFQHQQYQEMATRQLQRLRISCGDAFNSLWQQLHTTPPPSWLTEEGMVQAMMQQYLATIASAPDARVLAEFWQQVPQELEAPLMAMVEALISHAEAAGEAEMAEVFRKRLEDLRLIQAAATALSSASTKEKVSE
ncbi:hypothetical protein, partial [Archangium sp.]|uniref:hypothetical protein n=1 Tax=Archangium sp. TaxID=1872627 RepID=UPI002D3949F6